MEGIVDAKWTMAPLGLSRTSFVSNAEYAFEIFNYRERMALAAIDQRLYFSISLSR